MTKAPSPTKTDDRSANRVTTQDEAHLIQHLDYFHNHSIGGDLASITEALAKQEGMPWADIDWSGGPQPICKEGNLCNCGNVKCFYSSISNQSIGCVVGQGMGKHKAQLPIFEFEQKMATTFSTFQLQLNQTQLIPKLSSKVFQKALSLYGTPSNKDLWYFSTIKIPEPHLLIHIVHDNLQQDIVAFAPYIEDHNVFKLNFLKEIEKVEHILNHPAIFLLRNDFQLMIDSSGNVYHVDLDRIEGQYQFADVEQTVSGLKRVLYWLTDANGNFTGLADEVLFPFTRICCPKCQARVKKRLTDEFEHAKNASVSI